MNDWGENGREVGAVRGFGGAQIVWEVSPQFAAFVLIGR